MSWMSWISEELLVQVGRFPLTCAYRKNSLVPADPIRLCQLVILINYLYFWWLLQCERNNAIKDSDRFRLNSFAQWRYCRPWGFSEPRLLLVENYTQYPALIGFRADWAISGRFYGGGFININLFSHIVVRFGARHRPVLLTPSIFPISFCNFSFSARKRFRNLCKQ